MTDIFFSFLVHMLQFSAALKVTRGEKYEIVRTRVTGWLKCFC